MKNYLLLLAVVLGTLAAACRQNEKNTSEPSQSDSTEQPVSEPAYGCKVTLDQFKAVDQMVGGLYAISPFEESAFDSIEMLNSEIGRQLESLLACAASQELNLAGTLENLSYSQTEDGRIRNFNWYTNNGGTWQIFNCVYQYFLDETTAKTKFVGMSGGAQRFFQLSAEPPTYLGFGAEKTCSTCAAEYADLFSFKNDTLHLETVMGFDSRMGSVLDFDFNLETKTLHYAVALDDLNEDLKEEYQTYPVSELNLEGVDLEMLMAGEDAVAIVDSLVWDGGKFVEK